MIDQPSFDPKDEILAAADALAALAATCGSNGRVAEADEFYRMCADLELRSPELQDCWGGPLNGQVGRRRIMEDLIARYRPTCIIETGAFRGLTTDWLAQRFGGPISTCEASKRYFYQAKHNLAKHAHVSVFLSDSRSFLAGLDAASPVHARPLIYLDAHWEQDLPLREELQILMGAFQGFVAVIDDFEVSGDGGYSWDDYGGGDALTVDYLATAGLEGCRLLFPTLPSPEETGARRGCCVVSRNAPCALDDSGLLKGGSLNEWSKFRIGSGTPDVRPATASLHNSPGKAFDSAKASYPDQIVHLRQDLQAAQAEAIAKEAVIQDLKRTCDDRQHVIDELVRALEAERSR